MVNFRRVRITDINNSDGIDLNDFDGYLMTSPTGFGIHRISEYITVGNQRINTDNKPAFEKITFNIDIFGKRSEMEAKYAELRDFISNNIKKGFRLYYTPYNETRYVKCDINIVKKTEKESAYLPVSLEIQPKTLWLIDEKKASVEQVGQSGNVFRFSERRVNNAKTFTAKFELLSGVIDEYGKEYYSTEFFTGATNRAVLYNKGAETTPLMIRIYGECTNPVVRLIKEGSSAVSQIVSFDNLSIPQGYYLEINSDPENTYIELVNRITGERFDRESFANIETNMYMNLPQGNWIIDVIDESGNNKCYTDIFYSNQYYGG